MDVTWKGTLKATPMRPNTSGAGNRRGRCRTRMHHLCELFCTPELCRACIVRGDIAGALHTDD